MRDLSKDAKRQADASVKMAEEIEKQRDDTIRPVIDIELSQEPKDLMELGYSERESVLSRGLRSILINRGIWPAIDVFSLVRTPFDDFKELLHAYGVINRDGKSDVFYHSLKDNNGTLFFMVTYRDVYGRLLESKKELIGEKGKWELGRLHTNLIRTNDND